MVITITGHRPGKGQLTYDYKGPGVEYTREQVEFVLNLHKPELVYVGMALGFDTIVAITCVKKDIPYVAAIPFVGQELKWPDQKGYPFPPDSKNVYQILLRRAKYIHITNLNKDFNYEQYQQVQPTINKDSYGTIAIWMDKRNQWQTDQLIGPDDFLLSFHDGSLGGTYNCIQYAKSKGKKIINILPL